MEGSGASAGAGRSFLEMPGCRLADILKGQPRTAVTFDLWWVEGRPARLRLEYCTERVS